MDANKRQKLREIGYEIRPSCGTCVHFYDVGTAQMWSTCNLHTYEHLKHSKQKRHLSVHAAGWCPNHKPETTHLQGFDPFYKGIKP